ncbi:MAG: acyl-CoA thioesterase-1 [Verrucomicrobiales bacterium]|jgi:acyl-CoA thioesterase-1
MEIVKTSILRTIQSLILTIATVGMLLPGAAQDTDIKRVLILGDSLTKGYGLLPEQAYPALLQKKAKEAGMSSVVVLNGGVSGDTTAGGLRRMKWLMKKRIDVLMIALGGNDGLRGIVPAETAKSLQQIIDTARESNPDIALILAGMEMPDNMGKAYTESYRKVFPDIATKNKITLVPLLLEGVGGVKELNQPDFIHPNENGQEKVAATVWKTLHPVLKKLAD